MMAGGDGGVAGDGPCWTEGGGGDGMLSNTTGAEPGVGLLATGLNTVGMGKLRVCPHARQVNGIVAATCKSRSDRIDSAAQ